LQASINRTRRTRDLFSDQATGLGAGTKLDIQYSSSQDKKNIIIRKFGRIASIQGRIDDPARSGYQRGANQPNRTANYRISFSLIFKYC
jgi:hypothetical protein